MRESPIEGAPSQLLAPVVGAGAPSPGLVAVVAVVPSSFGVVSVAPSDAVALALSPSEEKGEGEQQGVGW